MSKSFTPWNSSEEITRELNELAEANGCTLCRSGYPDIYWGSLITTLARSMHKITKICGSRNYNAEDYGIALAERHGTGLTIPEFQRQIGNYNNLKYEETLEKIKNGTVVPSCMWNQNGWLCSQLGLHITSQTQKCLPTHPSLWFTFVYAECNHKSRWCYRNVCYCYHSHKRRDYPGSPVPGLCIWTKGFW